MAQGTLNIINQGFPSFRADLNDQLEALATLSSGPTAPTTTYPFQLWVDTSQSPPVLKQRNEANNAFVEIASIDGLLGTAATAGVTTSNTDTDTSRVMRPGNFGWGEITQPEPIPSGDYTAFDQSVPSGAYRHGADANNAPTTDNGVLIFARRSSSFSGIDGGAIHFRVPSDPQDVQAWIAAGRSNSPAVWREIYHTGNILGTVSQSNGAPTGAIIQRGSNSNGEFVRFADGTQICKFTYNNQRTTEDTVVTKTITFPAAFINTDYIPLSNPQTARPDNQTNAMVLGAGRTTSSAQFSDFRTTTTDADFNCVVIGRWF